VDVGSAENKHSRDGVSCFVSLTQKGTRTVPTTQGSKKTQASLFGRIIGACYFLHRRTFVRWPLNGCPHPSEFPGLVHEEPFACSSEQSWRAKRSVDWFLASHRCYFQDWWASAGQGSVQKARAAWPRRQAVQESRPDLTGSSPPQSHWPRDQKSGHFGFRLKIIETVARVARWCSAVRCVLLRCAHQQGQTDLVIVPPMPPFHNPAH